MFTMLFMQSIALHLPPLNRNDFTLIFAYWMQHLLLTVYVQFKYKIERMKSNALDIKTLTKLRLTYTVIRL